MIMKEECIIEIMNANTVKAFKTNNIQIDETRKFAIEISNQFYTADELRDLVAKLTAWKFNFSVQSENSIIIVCETQQIKSVCWC